MSINKETLCISLAKANSTADVISILEKHNLLDDPSCWKMLGGDEDRKTHGIVGNQQSSPIAALIEKLINCGDSALFLKCQEKGISPYSDEAPNSVTDAIKDLFEIDDGRWINADKKKESIASEFCNVVATGVKGKKLNLSIIDKAEGQHPHDFIHTFLSINSSKSKKDKVPFVQGKFGMGSFGVLNFCNNEEAHGKRLQLIISKRNPKLLKPGDTNLWGFTIISEFQNATDLPDWKFLVIDGDIPSFDSKDLKLFPSKYPNPYEGSFTHGSFIKLYDYEYKTRTNIIQDLQRDITTMLPNPVVPIRLHERREGYGGHTLEATIDGLYSKLARDRSNVIRKSFPTSFNFTVENEQFSGQIYAFDKLLGSNGKELTARYKEYGNGISYVLNGQRHGFEKSSLFSSSKVKLENISRRIAVFVDCSKVSKSVASSKLFKPDRETIYQNSFTSKIKVEIINQLVNHPGLREYQNEVRQNLISESIESKETTEMLQKFLDKNPLLLKSLFAGSKFENLFDKKRVEIVEEDPFEESYFASFFQIAKDFPKDNPRIQENERKARIKFLTDVPNDYFSREREPGEFKLYRNGIEISSLTGISLSGWNGEWNLQLPPQDIKEGEVTEYKFEVWDNNCINNPFINEFYVKAQKKIDKKQTDPNKKTKSKNNVDLPQLNEVYKEQWDDIGFDQRDLIKVEEGVDNVAVIHLNMNMSYFSQYLKSQKAIDVNGAKEQYKIAMRLFGMFVLNEYKESQKNTGNEDYNFESLGQYSKRISRPLAPLIMYLLRDIPR